MKKKAPIVKLENKENDKKKKKPRNKVIEKPKDTAVTIMEKRMKNLYSTANNKKKKSKFLFLNNSFTNYKTCLENLLLGGKYRV